METIYLIWDHYLNPNIKTDYYIDVVAIYRYRSAAEDHMHRLRLKHGDKGHTYRIEERVVI